MTFLLPISALPARGLSGVPAAANPSFEFLLGKLLAGEGAVPEALAAFQEAERLAPDSPYVRIEHAELLARLAQVVRKPGQQGDQLKQAGELVTQARRMAPDNRDVLRAAAAVYVLIAARDGSALESARDAYEAVLKQEPGDAQSAITLGRIYLEQQQPARAAEVFRDLIERAPQQRNAYALLVEALLQSQKSREAEAALQQLLALDAESLEARLTLAELQGQRDDHRAALATLLAAPESARNDPRLQRQLAWAQYLTGAIDAAQAALSPLRGADPDDLQLALLQGLIFSAQGRNAEAAELFVKVRAKRPEDPALTLALARVLERQGKSEAAAAAVSDLIAELVKGGKSDEERRARLELAQIYFGAKDWDKVGGTLAPLLAAGAKPAAPPSAEPGASPATPATPATPPTPPNAAKASGARDAEAASRQAAMLLAADAAVQQKAFDQALALLGPGSGSQIAAKRAEVLFKAGRDAEARRQLDGLVAGGDAEGLLAAAQAYQRLEKYADSVPLLERLVAGHQDSAAAGFLLGAAYERVGKREPAVAEFRRVLALEPDFHAALNYLGYMFAERGEHLDEARKLIERAVALDPDNGSYVDSLGWVYFRQGKFELARTTLERATRLETADATVQEHLGDVYGALGQAQRAGEAYRRALALGNSDRGKSDQLRRKLDSVTAAQRP